MGILRFFLAASVVIWHSYNNGYSMNWLPFNSVACVILFFVVSGFYMTLVLNEKYNDKHFFLFWSNRILRLWPSFIFATILMAIFVYPDLIFRAYKDTSAPTFLMIILSNFTMFAYELKDIGGLSANGNLVPFNLSETPLDKYFYLSPGWSLGLELWFYLLAPFIVRSFIKTILVFFLGIFFLASVKMIGIGELWAYRSFPPVISFFMLGSLSYHLGKIIEKHGYKKIYYAIGYYLILPITVILIIFPNILDNFIPDNHQAKFFMLTFFLFLPAWFISTKHSNFDNTIGSTSFPLYVIHPFIIFLSNDYSFLIFYPLLVLFLSLLVSFAMVYCIENPIDKWRQNRIYKNKYTR